MKIQEVILRAASGAITWVQAAEILGVTPRHMRRWRERYDADGYSGLLDRRRQQPSPKRVAFATVEQILQLYRERYFDFNVRHFHEVLVREHEVTLSYNWVKTALQTAGVGAPGEEARAAPPSTRAPPAPGDALAYRCEPPRLAAGRATGFGEHQ